MSCIIYADIESLIRKIDECANNPENSWTTKVDEYIPCGYSMSSIWGIWLNSKQTYFILCKRLYQKVLWIFKRTQEKYILFWKEENVKVNKRRIKITSKCKSMSYIWIFILYTIVIL